VREACVHAVWARGDLNSLFRATREWPGGCKQARLPALSRGQRELRKTKLEQPVSVCGLTHGWRLILRTASNEFI
jgi:hypothetical protein